MELLRNGKKTAIEIRELSSKGSWVLAQGMEQQAETTDKEALKLRPLAGPGNFG